MNPHYIPALLICLGFALLIAIAFIIALERRRSWKDLDDEDEAKKLRMERQRKLWKRIAMRRDGGVRIDQS
jgi:hypothetical protein